MMKKGNNSPTSTTSGQETPLPSRVEITADSSLETLPPDLAALPPVLSQLDTSMKDFDQAEAILDSNFNRAEQIRASHLRVQASQRFTDAWDTLAPHGTITFDHTHKHHTLLLP